MNDMDRLAEALGMRFCKTCGEMYQHSDINFNRFGNKKLNKCIRHALRTKSFMVSTCVADDSVYDNDANQDYHVAEVLEYESKQ